MNTEPLRTTIVFCFILLFSSEIALAQTAAGWSENAGNTTTTNKVGIGTTSPGTALDVNGATTLRDTVSVGGYMSVTGTANFNAFPSPFTILGGPSAGNTVYGSGIDTTLDIAGGRSPFVLQWHRGLNFAAHTAYGGIRFFNQGYPAPYNAQLVMAITNGSVGIGTAAPATTLDVNGPTTLRSSLAVTGSTTLSGALGVGGTLGVTGTANFNAFPSPFTILGGPSAGNPVYGSGIDTTLDIAGGRIPFVLQWHSGLNFAAHTSYGGIRFYNQAYPSPYNAQLVMALTSGRVGIGTANPGYLLDVAGDAHFSGTVSGGNIQAQYQDVAEWVPASTSMSPGTVVVLNPEKSNEVMPSQAAYDTAVAGVVSGQPGVLLGVASPSKAQIATMGRVKVHVDASEAPIRIGDLLVTSDKPGVAMRSEGIDLGGVKIHRPGTLIGKALEPLEGGEGEILVLLSLQ